MNPPFLMSVVYLSPQIIDTKYCQILIAHPYFLEMPNKPSHTKTDLFQHKHAYFNKTDIHRDQFLQQWKVWCFLSFW